LDKEILAEQEASQGGQDSVQDNLKQAAN